MKRTFICCIVSFLFFYACQQKQSKNDQITISFWESEDSVVAPYLDAITTQFEKENPNVKVTRTHYGVEDLHTQFQSASIAGSAPEVLLSASDKAGLFAASGLILPLDNLFDFTAYEKNAVLATIQDGKIWGVPNSYGNELLLYYNTDYVKEPPKSTQELFKICDDIMKRKNDFKNIMTCFELNQCEPFWLIPLLTSFGGFPIKNHIPDLDTQAMIDSLNFMKDLKTRKYMSQECDYNCLDSMFKEGKTAMIINGDWTVDAYLESMKGKMKIAILPINSKTNLAMKPMISGKYFFISSTTSNKQLEYTIKLINTFNTLDNQNKMKTKLKKLPALKTAFRDPKIKSDPLYSVMAKQINNGVPMPSEVEMRAVWDIMRQYQGLVLSNKMDAGKAVKRMQEESVKRIEEMKM